MIDEWINTARWCYNTAVAYCRKCIKEQKYLPDREELRLKFIKKENIEGTEIEWTLRTPNDIRDDAMNDVLLAYESNFAKRRANPKHKFKIKFKKKKELRQEIIHIHRKAFVNRNLNPIKMKECSLSEIENKLLKKSEIKLKTTINGDVKEELKLKIATLKKKQISKEELEIKRKKNSNDIIPDDIIYDSILLKSKLGKYYFTLLKPIEKMPENQRPNQDENEVKCIALGININCFYFKLKYYRSRS